MAAGFYRLTSANIQTTLRRSKIDVFPDLGESFSVAVSHLSSVAANADWPLFPPEERGWQEEEEQAEEGGSLVSAFDTLTNLTEEETKTKEEIFDHL